ncbi:MAG: hypothetical protein WKG07_39490 [Hymenobacter sp.]
MKIRFNFIVILPLVAVLATNAAFWEFIYGPQVDQEPEGVKLYTYVLFAASVGTLVLYARYMEPLVKRWMWWWWPPLAD